ncbi:PREDICTED: ribonuclease 3-like protein 3 [Tarenaya hassleriana]|uniref:ribonuclease 3-like protein 3 n=1 Tax=Tarenaya hassleriana TaxID=28532 RepID=UPI00053C9B70|nr:PREDICTED: ribonuclease 3-like protein 3 [Tarenaya hassleriana]
MGPSHADGNATENGSGPESSQLSHTDSNTTENGSGPESAQLNHTDSNTSTTENGSGPESAQLNHIDNNTTGNGSGPESAQLNHIENNNNTENGSGPESAQLSHTDSNITTENGSSPESAQLNHTDNSSTTENGSSPESSQPGPHEPPLAVEFVEEILHYQFKEKHLLQEAFTHASYGESVSYERLEYIGDSVLNLLITKEFFSMYPELPPGLLTRRGAANVDTEKLARVAVKHGLYRFLRHKKPLLEDQVKEFSEAIEEYPLHSHGLIRVPKALADIVESTVGALFLDCNSIDTVWEVFKPLLEPIIYVEKLRNHPKAELHEKCQKCNLKLRFQDTWEKNREIVVFIDDRLVGRGSHHLKKESARNIAAKNALDRFPDFFDDKLLLIDSVLCQFRPDIK